MRFHLFIISIAAWAGILVAGTVYAAQTSTVTATVTPQNISVSVSDGGITYGSQALGAARNTTSGQENETQTATNDGNITEDLNAKGNNTAAWTLATQSGANIYTHELSTNSGTKWLQLAASYKQWSNALTSTGVNTDAFDLQITLPSSTSSYSQQSADVDIQAVAD